MNIAVTDRTKTSKPRGQETRQGVPLLDLVAVLAIGVYLGIVFVKSEVASWERIHRMFRFEEARMYIIIGVAVGVAMIGMRLIKQFGIKDVRGRPIVYQPKPYHLGVVIGGMIFGAGWAITGACPGPIYAQIGAGQGMAVITLLGALAGMFCYAALKPRLPH